MKVAHVVPCRDKEDCVAMSVMSVLNQDCSPMHIVLSDQGSQDNTLKIVKYLAKNYTGPHKVSVLECPETDPKGMRGMNAHLDWIMGQIDEDIIFITSASDWSHPERMKKSLKLFEEFKPDMVLNALQFLETDGTVAGVTAHPSNSGFVDPKTCLDGLVGGSTAHSMTRDFIEACNGFKGISGFDVYMPFLACCRNGAYFDRELLHAYIKDNTTVNTGLEGVIRATEDEMAKIQVEEMIHFQVTSAFIQAARILDDWGDMDSDKRQSLYEHILGRCASWTDARCRLTVARVQPTGLKA